MKGFISILPVHKFAVLFALPLLVFLLSSFPPSPSFATEGWEFHRSESGSFEVRFPRKYLQKIRYIRQDEFTVVYSNEFIARIGDDPNSKSNKTYIMKVDQTLGHPLRQRL